MSHRLLLRRISRLEVDRAAAGPRFLVVARWGEAPAEAVRRHVDAWSREHGDVPVPRTWGALVVGELVDAHEWTRMAAEVAREREDERIEAERKADEATRAQRDAERERAQREQARVLAQQEIDREVKEMQRQPRGLVM